MPGLRVSRRLMRKSKDSKDRRAYPPRRATDMGIKNRLLEVALTGVLSIIASAFVTSWTLSAKLTNFENGIKGNTDSIGVVAQQAVQLRSSIAATEGVNANQSAQIAVADARYGDIVRRLDSIEGKVDSLAGRR